MVLLAIDLQRGILVEDLYNYEEFVANMKKLLSEARARGVEVIYVQHDAGEGSGFTKGDITGDNKVDVEDVNAAINIILETKTEADFAGSADLNDDGKVDVEDVNAIINIILEVN